LVFKAIENIPITFYFPLSSKVRYHFARVSIIRNDCRANFQSFGTALSGGAKSGKLYSISNVAFNEVQPFEKLTDSK